MLYGTFLYAYFMYILLPSLIGITVTFVDFHTSNLYNSYFCIFVSLQNIGVLYVFNANSKHRKKNRLYNLYLCVLLYYMISFMTNSFLNKNWDDNMLFLIHPQLNLYDSQILRLKTISISILNFLVSLLYESLIERIFK
jgi:hypothetical protein